MTVAVTAYAALIATISLGVKIITWRHERRVKVDVLLRLGWCERVGFALDALFVTVINAGGGEVTWVTGTLMAATTAGEEATIRLPIESALGIGPMDSDSWIVALRDLPPELDLEAPVTVSIGLQNGETFELRRRIRAKPAPPDRHTFPEIWA
jgi:hypothetical protein